MEHQKKFSIIIPVYNAAAYLETSIECVINQTCSFENNVELILVNDGSKDQSGEICETYHNLYPHNIIYIEQKNAGVSAARNRGLEAATGEIIGFLDADDKFSRNVLSSVLCYFNVALDMVDVAIIPVKNFGAKTFPYYLSGKFAKGTRTVELSKPNWDDVCMRVGQAFVRSEVAKKYAFDSSVTFFEDAKYINEIVSEKMRMGLVAGCSYFYRRYPSEADSATSLTVGAETNTRLYLETPVKVVLHFLERYQDETDTPLYFQYLALCEMRWRLFYTQNRTSEFLTAKEYEEYENINDRIFHYISDQAIMNFGYYSDWQKLYLLNLKHKTDVFANCEKDEEKGIVWNGNTLSDLKNAEVMLTDIDLDNAECVVTGFFNVLISDDIECIVRMDGEKLAVCMCDETIPATEFPLDYEFYSFRLFRVRIPLPRDMSYITFSISINGKECEIRSVKPSARGNVKRVNPSAQCRKGYIIGRELDKLIICKAKLKYLYSEYIKKAEFGKRISKKCKTFQGTIIRIVKRVVTFPLRKFRKILNQ